MISRSKSKGNTIHCPKGSYHNYCRRKIQQQYHYIGSSMNPNLTSATQNLTRRKIQSTHTNRISGTVSVGLKTNRANKDDKFIGLTFEEYLAMFEKSHEYQRNNNVSPTKQNVEQQINNRKKIKSKSENKMKARNNYIFNKKKLDDDVIIDSHLPFFKCKIEKKQVQNYGIRGKDFRIKQNKFKLNYNIVQQYKHLNNPYSAPIIDHFDFE